MPESFRKKLEGNQEGEGIITAVFGVYVYCPGEKKSPERGLVALHSQSALPLFQSPREGRPAQDLKALNEPAQGEGEFIPGIS